MRRALSLLCGLLLASVASTAAAQGRFRPEHGAAPEGGERLAVGVPERGIVIGDQILGAELNVGYSHLTLDFLNLGSLGANAVGIDATVAYGITKNFQVDTTFGPDIELASEDSIFSRNKTSVSFRLTPGMTYRFVEGTAEVGVRAQLGFAFGGEISSVAPGLGLPVRVHLGKRASLDTGLAVSVLVPFEGGGVIINPFAPLAFKVDVVEPYFHIGVNTGIGAIIVASEGGGGALGYVPVGFEMGVAIPGKHGPILDIDPYFLWPHLVGFGGGSDTGSAVITESWQLGVKVGGFFYF